ncbi:MAG: GNAT family N-acetyltransferase [Pseudomonadota bacterium]
MATAAPVRHLIPEDREVWESLFRAYHAFYEVTVPDAVYPSTWSRLLSQDPGTHVGFVALGTDEVPIGLAHALFHQSTWVETGHVYLQDLFVDPHARGHGAGRALIEAVYAYADGLGAARTYWLTHESNATARVLYDRVATESGFIQYRR